MNKFKQGDYIVSLEDHRTRDYGQIFKVPKTHKDDKFVYYQTKSSKLADRTFAKTDSFREAKNYEIELYKEGGIKKNIGQRLVKEKFPLSGWCENPSKDIRNYIKNTFKPIKMAYRPGKKGLAWNFKKSEFNKGFYSGSTWKIESKSSYKKYTKLELERLIPQDINNLSIDVSDLKSSHALSSDSDLSIPVHNPIDSFKINELPSINMLLDYSKTIMFNKTTLKKKEDEYTQQEAVILKKSKKK